LGLAPDRREVGDGVRVCVGNGGTAGITARSKGEGSKGKIGNGGSTGQPATVDRVSNTGQTGAGKLVKRGG